MKNLLIYFFLFFVASPLSAQKNNTFFRANEAYGGQDYEKAIELLEASPTHSFAHYFNLGCAYQKNNDRNRAWIAFEKAKQINPCDKRLKHAFQALSLTREQQKFIPFYQTSFVINILTIMVCIFFWLTIWLLMCRCTKKVLHKSAFYFSLLGCIGSGGGLYASSHIFKKCITIYENTDIHISPTSQSEIIQNISIGTPLRVSAKYGKFLHVNLKNRQNGWIDCQNVKYILD